MQKRRQSWIISDKEKAKNKQKKWSLRGSLLTAFVAIISLIGSILGINVAMADTGSPFPTTAPAGQVCKDIDGVTTCINEAKVTETKPVTVTKTNATSKTYEYVMKDGYKTKAKVYSGSSYKAIMSAHPNAKAIRITKNGQKFCNSVHNPAGNKKVKSSCSGNGSTQGDRVYFSDYVGSSDSKAGTSSATFYWDAKAKTWRKGNCGNPVKFIGSMPKLTVKQIKIVREITTTVSAPIDYSLTRAVIAEQKCENDAVSAYGRAYAKASVSIHQMLTASAKSTGEANANFAAEYLKLQLSLKQKVWLEAKGSIDADLLAQAQAGCQLKPTKTPTPAPTITITATPTPAPTITVTPPAVVTPPVVITYIPVCDTTTKKIVPVNQDNYDKTRYTTDLSKCNVENPPVVKIPVCDTVTKTIVPVNQADYDKSRYTTDLDQCKTPPTTVTYIPVCDTKTQTIVPFLQTDYDKADKSRYTTDLNQCKEKPPVMITVCVLSSKQIKDITQDEYTKNPSLYSKNQDDCKTVTPPTPQPEKPVVHINQKNDVDQSSIDPGTGKLDESTAPVFFTYTIWGSNSASVKVEAKFGAIRDISSTSVKGEGKVTFTYVAPADYIKPGGYLTDTITVTLKDASSGMTASDSTDIKVNATPEIAK